MPSRQRAGTAHLRDPRRAAPASAMPHEAGGRLATRPVRCYRRRMRASPGERRLQPGRRRLLKLGAALRLAPAAWLAASVAAPARAAGAFSRVRPGDPAWPDASRWKELEAAVGGSLLTLRSPFADCLAAASAPACTQRFTSASNPVRPGDDAGPDADLRLGRCLDLVGRASMRSRRGTPPMSSPRSTSRARSPAPRRQGRRPQLPGHVERGRFAAGLDPRDERGDAPRRLRRAGLRGRRRAGARRLGRRRRDLGAVYDAVTTKGGGYVQGGGCMTVGVAGLIQSGGFGSFSKAYGLARGEPARSRSGDRRRRGAHRQRLQRSPICSGRLKGGGGGSLGVVTRADLARASAAGGLRRGEPDGAGGVAGGLSPARRHDPRFLRRRT